MVYIHLVDALSGVHFCEVEVDMETFGRLVTGLSYLPAKAEVGNFDLLGCTQEHAVAEVHAPFREGQYKYSTEDLDRISAPYEVDGWKLRRSDIGNMHRSKGGNIYSVTKSRFIRPDGSVVV